MHITRTEKYRKKRRIRHQKIATIAGILSIVSTSIASIHTPTLGLFSHSITNSSNFQALQMFPSTIMAFVEESALLRSEAMGLLDLVQSINVLPSEEMLFDLSDDQLFYVFEHEIIDEDDAMHPDEPFAQPFEEGQQTNVMLDVAIERAIAIYEQINLIHEQLLMISAEYTDETIRQKLLLDMALQEVEGDKREVQQVIDQLIAQREGKQRSSSSIDPNTGEDVSENDQSEQDPSQDSEQDEEGLPDESQNEDEGYGETDEQPISNLPDEPQSQEETEYGETNQPPIIEEPVDEQPNVGQAID